MTRLKEMYNSKVVPSLLAKMRLKNRLEVPTLKKIVIGMGVGKFKSDKNYLEEAQAELAAISGQRPVFRLSKIAISGFKLQKGEKVGLMVTLRGDRMWDFFDKLVNIVLPRLRDFRGVSRSSFDRKGNYTLGIKEHIVFSEVGANKATAIKGLKVTIVTTAKDDDSGRMLLAELGMPFEK